MGALSPLLVPIPFSHLPRGGRRVEEKLPDHLGMVLVTPLSPEISLGQLSAGAGWKAVSGTDFPISCLELSSRRLL